MGLINFDKIIHEPVRLEILSYLFSQDSDFSTLGDLFNLTDGNLSSHMAKLSSQGYIRINKLFINKKPKTKFKITTKGKQSLKKYKQTMLGLFNKI